MVILGRPYSEGHRPWPRPRTVVLPISVFRKAPASRPVESRGAKLPEPPIRFPPPPPSIVLPGWHFHETGYHRKR